MKKKEHLREFLTFLKGIRKASYKKKILVEGKKDEEALASFGIKNVEPLNGRPIYKIAEDFKNEDVLLLLDNDEAGKELQKKVIREFERIGVNYSLKFQKKSSGFIDQIETLTSFFENLNGKQITFREIHHPFSIEGRWDCR